MMTMHLMSVYCNTTNSKILYRIWTLTSTMSPKGYILSYITNMISILYYKISCSCRSIRKICYNRVVQQWKLLTINCWLGNIASIGIWRTLHDFVNDRFMIYYRRKSLVLCLSYVYYSFYVWSEKFWKK